MPKYVNSVEKQMAILKMQSEYTFDLKMVKRMRSNQMLARGTANFFKSIRNVFIRNYLMKKPSTVIIKRDYLIPEYKQHLTYDLFDSLNDNTSNSIHSSSYALLFLSIGFIFGYYLCRINNDINDFQYYCYVRYPHQMQLFNRFKQLKWSENSERSILDEFYYRTDFEKGELKTRSGYFRMRERIKEDIFNTKQKEILKEKKQEELNKDIKIKDVEIKELESFLEEQGQKLKSIEEQNNI